MSLNDLKDIAKSGSTNLLRIGTLVTTGYMIFVYFTALVSLTMPPKFSLTISSDGVKKLFFLTAGIVLFYLEFKSVSLVRNYMRFLESYYGKSIAYCCLALFIGNGLLEPMLLGLGGYSFFMALTGLSR
jgi:hypothetical protein